jgi:hypothetical protein
MSDSARGPAIHACQLGYLCDSRKRIALAVEVAGGLAGGAAGFEIQDMSRIDAQALDGRESWKTVFRGPLSAHAGPMGAYLVGDFSDLRSPGVYRAALPGRAGFSYPFVISDGAFSRLPSLFLDYVHSRRCGDFEDELRGPCHLDDGRRSDTGEQADAAGGWHDAGDLRKWMATTTLPILSFFELRSRLAFSRNNWRERPHEDDLLAEAAWGLRWILKMQDPATGMFFEDVGGGVESGREPGASWWSENHAGCCADNAGNYFSDNRPASGDERMVRARYNPIAQYVNATILLDAIEQFHAHYPAFSALCREAALRCWTFMKARRRDEFHGWTSVLSWRLLAALRLHAMGVVAESEVAALVSVLLDLQSREGGFWFMDTGRTEPYRGIVNAAQPSIALSAFIENDYEHPLAAQARDSLERHWESFAAPLLATNPFGMMPYGLYRSPRAGEDVYHEASGPGMGGLCYRFFMPASAHGAASAHGVVNHGLASHWTSWAHAFSSLARVLERRDCRHAAFDQLAWLMGNNPLNASAVSGVGYLNVVPYSNFQGPMPGGFCNGPRGRPDDSMEADLEGTIQWSTGEYWMVPLANSLLALAGLIPMGVLPSKKLGAR